MTMTDKESVAQLLKETIVQLCKANIFYSGQVEIDGIICISGQVEGQELVIKVHEIFATPQDLRNPYAAITCQPLAAKFSDLQNLYGDYHRQELKRRRLESGFDFHPSIAYSYLSKLVYGQNHPNAFPQPGLDQRNGATDLSIKSSLAASNHRADLQSESSLSPYQSVETKYDVRDELQPLQTPVRSLLGGKTTLLSDGCVPVPGKSLLSLLPQCRVCFCSFESPESLSDHNELAHSVFTCLCCFKTFTSRSNLERHSRLHTGHRPFACDVCGKSFSRKDHLSNHAAKHAFKCGACSHRCADRAALVSHCLHDHGAALTNVCAFCNKGFCGAEQYEEHLKSHPQWNADSDDTKMNSESPQVAARSLLPKDRYSCVSCNFETNDKVSVAKHQLVHSNERRLYTCLGCGKIYEDPLQYSDHLILHQKERDIFECCICRQVCGTLSSLRRHEAAHVSDDNSDMEGVAEDDGFQCGETLQFLQEHSDVHKLAKQRQSCHLYEKTFENQVGLDPYPSAKEGQGHVAPEETSNCIEECSGVVDVASRRDKRKQKQPKPAVNVSSEMVGAGESDIEVAEPRSPGVREDEKSCDFVISVNPACVIPVSGVVEIKMEPPKSILNRATTPVVSIKPLNNPVEAENGGLPCLLPTKLEGPEETVERARGKMENRVRLSAKHRGRKGRHRGTHASRSGHLAGLLENHVLPDGSPGVNVMLNNNLISARNENHPHGGDVPSGPFACVICSFETDTFQALDGHCVTSHSRSPCMFCAKTFAQKANRDRHHCLHTGDKPYGCPECGEKFSRGDKLKMHRVRAHGVQYPLYGSRQKDTSSRDREFASSSPGFLSLQSDGFSPMASTGFVTSLPALPAFEGREPDDDDADLRTSDVGVGDVDEVGRHVSKFSGINADLAKNWKTEKNGSIHWVKTQLKETEVDEENNILEDVAPMN